MSFFENSFKKALKLEGGFTNDPDDLGKATNYGISLRFVIEQKDKEYFDLNGDEKLDEIDIQLIDEEFSREIYKKYWWDKFNLDKVKDEMVATKIFINIINIGPYMGIKLLQRAYNATCLNSPPINADGILGPKTIEAINGSSPYLLCSFYNFFVIDFYEDLVKKRPKLNKYLRGWLNRVEDAEH